MTTRHSNSNAGHTIIKIAALITFLILLFVLIQGIGSAHANDTIGSPLRSADTGALPQVSTEADATLAGLTLSVGGETAALMPAFRPEVTRYEATNGEAVIDQFITGDDATVPDPLSNRLTTTVALAEGVITNLSLRMLAADEATAVISSGCGPWHQTQRNVLRQSP